MAPGNGQSPVFVFDSREEFKPLAVESIEALKAKLIKSDGGDGGAVALDALPDDGGRMNLPAEPEKYEGKMQAQFGNVGYRRTVKGGRLDWVQYWLWYLHNPKKVIVTGDHEGDWEFVQVAYAGDQPVCMTASQHHSGGSRMWWELEKRDGRPVVYVALGSHANYFAKVDQLPEIGDKGDGKGEVLDSFEWRDFGSWATWPGRWGNSTEAGRSPQSPGSQGERWSRPHRYHSKADHQV
jgi:hypothetical protein